MNYLNWKESIDSLFERKRKRLLPTNSYPFHSGLFFVKTRLSGDLSLWQTFSDDERCCFSLILGNASRIFERNGNSLKKGNSRYSCGGVKKKEHREKRKKDRYKGRKKEKRFEIGRKKCNNERRKEMKLGKTQNNWARSLSRISYS